MKLKNIWILGTENVGFLKNPVMDVVNKCEAIIKSVCLVSLSDQQTNVFSQLQSHGQLVFMSAISWDRSLKTRRVQRRYIRHTMYYAYDLYDRWTVHCVLITGTARPADLVHSTRRMTSYGHPHSHRCLCIVDHITSILFPNNGILESWSVSFIFLFHC